MERFFLCKCSNVNIARQHFLILRFLTLLAYHRVLRKGILKEDNKAVTYSSLWISTGPFTTKNKYKGTLLCTFEKKNMEQGDP